VCGPVIEKRVIEKSVNKKQNHKYPHHKGLICVSCIQRLEKDFRVREAMRLAEDSYFVVHRRKLLKNGAKPVGSQMNIQLPPAEKIAAIGIGELSMPGKTKTPMKLKGNKTQRETKFKCRICGKFFAAL
jgi:hypothetical protein